jgi:hypothetical protein
MLNEARHCITALLRFGTNRKAAVGRLAVSVGVIAAEMTAGKIVSNECNIDHTTIDPRGVS